MPYSRQDPRDNWRRRVLIHQLTSPNPDEVPENPNSEGLFHEKPLDATQIEGRERERDIPK